MGREAVQRRASKGRTAFAVALALTAAFAVAGAAASPSKPQAHALAKALGLRRGDLPGFDVQPGGSPSVSVDEALASCYGGVPYHEVLADVLSPAFLKGATLLDSEVEIYASAAVASRDLTASNTARGRSCQLASYETGDATAFPGQRIIGSATELAGWSARGVPSAIRLVLHIQASKTKPARTDYLDTFTFTAGVAEVAMNVDTLGSPPSLATEQRVMSLLVSRARKGSR
jgi:hypothetical protein